MARENIGESTDFEGIEKGGLPDIGRLPLTFQYIYLVERAHFFYVSQILPGGRCIALYWFVDHRDHRTLCADLWAQSFPISGACSRPGSDNFYVRKKLFRIHH